MLDSDNNQRAYRTYTLTHAAPHRFFGFSARHTRTAHRYTLSPCQCLFVTIFNHRWRQSAQHKDITRTTATHTERQTANFYLHLEQFFSTKTAHISIQPKYDNIGHCMNDSPTSVATKHVAQDNFPNGLNIEQWREWNIEMSAVRSLSCKSYGNANNWRLAVRHSRRRLGGVWSPHTLSTLADCRVATTKSGSRHSFHFTFIRNSKQKWSKKTKKNNRN